ncbi:hypothetical protein XPA_007650 [Xanthoria parietina]
MYIIDDAHESYDESMMWEEQFKDGVRDKNNHFLLVCVYGAASGRNSWGRAASQSATIQPESRIELLPHAPHMLQVRMVKEEVHEVIRRWAASRVIPIDCHESTFEFLWYETQGHPGVLKLVLEFINLKGLSVIAYHGEPYHYGASQCHKILGEVFIKYWVPGMPGYWNEESKNSFSEDGAKKLQPYRRFDGIDENDVGMAVSYTASQLKGAWVEKSGAKENNEAGSMALKLAAAAQTGFLHSVDHEGWTEYTFASQFHKRAAIMCASPFPQHITSLLDTIVNALRSFSPSALTSRTTRPNHEWVIPEATFQAEIYRCLQRILPGCFIATEYQHNQSGRVDFYLPEDRLGLELLQNGTLDEIEEHTEHVDTLCGKYGRWGIMKDFLVVNFCFGSKHQDLRNTRLATNQKLFWRTLQVIYNQQEQTLTVYGADHQPKFPPMILVESHTSSMNEGDYPAGWNDAHQNDGD